LINNKYYIGVHSENRASDGYIGCGVCSQGTAIKLKNKGVKSAFVDSVIKYGYKNFKREIIKEFDTIDEAYKYESDIVNKDLVNSKDCLNIRLGGFGGTVLSICKKIEIMNCKTGELIKFNSMAECANFLGLKNISGRKRFLNNSYVLKNHNIPIEIKRYNENSIYFHDIYQACKYTGIDIFSLKRLLSKERKSCKGWFLSDFDFNSSFYKNAKKIRKSIKKDTKSSPKSRKGKY